MDLKQSQYLLSRLYAEGVFRRTFFADRDRFYRNEQIADPELIRFLNELKQEQVEFFAKGLLAKRLHAVALLLPATRFLLGGEFGNKFREFAELFQPSGIHKHQEDAIAFCRFIKTRFPESPAREFILSQLTFEQKQVEEFLAGNSWSMKKFSFNPVDFQRQLLAGNKPVLPAKSRTFILWRKGKIVRVIGGK